MDLRELLTCEESFKQRNISDLNQKYLKSANLCIGWFYKTTNKKSGKPSNVPHLILLNLRRKGGEMHDKTKNATIEGTILFFWQTKSNHHLYGLFKDKITNSVVGDNAYPVSLLLEDGYSISLSLCAPTHLQELVYNNGYSQNRLGDIRAKVLFWNSMCGIIPLLEVQQRRKTKESDKAVNSAMNKKRKLNEVISIPQNVYRSMMELAPASFNARKKFRVKSVDCGNNYNVMRSTTNSDDSADLKLPKAKHCSPAELNYLIQDYSQRFWKQSKVSLELSTIPFQTFVNMVRWLKDQVKGDPYVMGKVASRMFEQMGWKLAKPEPLLLYGADENINFSSSLDLDQVSLEVKHLEESVMSFFTTGKYESRERKSGSALNHTRDNTFMVVEPFLREIYKLVKDQVRII